jgi:hypothetical protein
MLEKRKTERRFFVGAEEKSAAALGEAMGPVNAQGTLLNS